MSYPRSHKKVLRSQVFMTIKRFHQIDSFYHISWSLSQFWIFIKVYSFYHTHKYFATAINIYLINCFSSRNKFQLVVKYYFSFFPDNDRSIISKLMNLLTIMNLTLLFDLNDSSLHLCFVPHTWNFEVKILFHHM